AGKNVVVVGGVVIHLDVALIRIELLGLGVYRLPKAVRQSIYGLRIQRIRNQRGKSRIQHVGGNDVAHERRPEIGSQDGAGIARSSAGSWSARVVQLRAQCAEISADFGCSENFDCVGRRREVQAPTL